jgi:hypothetical protein
MVSDPNLLIDSMIASAPQTLRKHAPRPSALLRNIWRDRADLLPLAMREKPIGGCGVNWGWSKLGLE